MWGGETASHSGSPQPLLAVALLSERSSPQLCHLPEAVLLTDLQGGSAAGVAVDAVGLLSCVPRS